MSKNNKSVLMVPNKNIESRIHLVRNQKVMFSHDLAALYQVTTKSLNQAVRRNPERFPEDFMFQLTPKECENLRSQFVTSSYGGRRYLPYGFTEHGILMLSSVLNSGRAIAVNIQIMRSFVKLREMIAANELIRQKIEELERKFDKHEKQFKIVFDAIRDLLEPASLPPKKPIGFHANY